MGVREADGTVREREVEVVGGLNPTDRRLPVQSARGNRSGQVTTCVRWPAPIPSPGLNPGTRTNANDTAPPQTWQPQRRTGARRVLKPQNGPSRGPLVPADRTRRVYGLDALVPCRSAGALGSRRMQSAPRERDRFQVNFKNGCCLQGAIFRVSAHMGPLGSETRKHRRPSRSTACSPSSAPSIALRRA